MDPVLVSTSGDELAGPAILDALRYSELLYFFVMFSPFNAIA